MRRDEQSPQLLHRPSRVQRQERVLPRRENHREPPATAISSAPHHRARGNGAAGSRCADPADRPSRTRRAPRLDHRPSGAPSPWPPASNGRSLRVGWGGVVAGTKVNDDVSDRMSSLRRWFGSTGWRLGGSLGVLRLPVEDLVDALAGLAMLLGHRVGVRVERDTDVGVSKAFLHDLVVAHSDAPNRLCCMS